MKRWAALRWVLGIFMCGALGVAVVLGSGGLHSGGAGGPHALVQRPPSVGVPAARLPPADAAPPQAIAPSRLRHGCDPAPVALVLHIARYAEGLSAESAAVLRKANGALVSAPFHG